jgi:VIT1/CCC1 family predicted Fe2+/Mn2+ transporter
MAKNHSFTNLSKTLQAGIVTGFISTSIGNFLGIITQSIAQTYYQETSIAAITIASLSLGIVGSIIYYFIYLQTKQYARDIFTMIGLTLPTMITMYILSNQYDSAFRIIAVSISYAVSMTTVILVPFLAEKYKFGEDHHHN